MYRDGQALAWVTALEEGGEQKLFLHADHLGSTRLVTGAAGQQVSRHDFLPFGEESTAVTAGDTALKFTGHERDQPGKPMDYMHARHYSPILGRFLSIDRALSQSPASPQAWNRYSYVRNNPVSLTDPTGNCSDPGGTGIRICVESFIPGQMFGPFAGDGRRARPDGGPAFRTRQTLELDPNDKGKILKEEFTPGYSETGFLRRQASVGENFALRTMSGISVSAKASDGLFFGMAPDLSYSLLISENSAGELSLDGSHTAFPSLEVWVYEDGQAPLLLYSYEAPARGVYYGVKDILTTIPVQDSQR